MNNNKSIFTISYLPSIQYFAHWLNANNPVIEKYDNYLKRTFRNRCNIMAANGSISLTVPVIKSKEVKTKTKDVEISYDTNWQALHWRSIVSAYSSSPFFEYYLEDFKPFYEKKYRFLFDFNLRLMRVIFDALDLQMAINFTDDFISPSENLLYDFRETIHPKKDYGQFDSAFKSISYRQVFCDRFPFTPNLSIIDLVFNKGPEAVDVLEDSIVLK